MSNLKEGEDYYLNEDGFLVFTAAHHLKRGSCCGNGCKHCPWPPLTPPKEEDYRSEVASPKLPTKNRDRLSKGGGLS